MVIVGFKLISSVSTSEGFRMTKLFRRIVVLRRAVISLAVTIADGFIVQRLLVVFQLALCYLSCNNSDRHFVLPPVSFPLIGKL